MFLANLAHSQCQPWCQPFLPGALVPLTGDRYLESKTWAPGAFTAARASLLLGPPLCPQVHLSLCVLPWTPQHSACVEKARHAPVPLPKLCFTSVHWSQSPVVPPLLSLFPTFLRSCHSRSRVQSTLDQSHAAHGS